MRVLITGVAGFIGFHLAKKLCEKGIHVCGIDNLDEYYDLSLKKSRLNILDEYKNFLFINIDLNDLSVVKEKFDFAINLAAQAGVRLPDSMNYKYVHSNIKGFDSFLNFCNQAEVENIIYASSSSVYSNYGFHPFKENIVLPEPLSKYAETKINNEISSKEFFLNKGINNVVGLRFFTVYGSYGRPDMAYFKFTSNIIKNKEIVLFNGGDLERDMTHIDDIIEGIIQTIRFMRKQKKIYEILNFGNGKPIKTSYLLELIEEKLNKKALIKFINTPNEVKITHADCSKANRLVGYKPNTEIEQGIPEFIFWFKKYFNI